MRTAPALALLGFLLATAGCGSDDGPPTPTAPPRVTFPASPPPPERLLVRLDGVFYAPGSVIELSPGNPIEIEVLVYPNTSFPLEGPTPNWAGFVVETDAPAERLLIRRSIAWREVYEREDPETGDPTQVGVAVGIIRLEALESGETTDPGEVHEVRIGAPAGGFQGPPEIEVDTTPLRFRVVAPSPAISCDELTLTAEPDHRSGEPGGFFRRLFEDAGEFNSGRITLRGPGFGAGLRLVAPYRFRGGELTACGKTHAAFDRRYIPAEPRRFAPLIVAFRSKYTRYSSLTRLVSRAPHRSRRSRGFHHRLLTDTEWDPSAQRKTDEIGFPFLFAAGMNLRAVEGGFEQTFELGWFDELELVAHAPGCESRRLRCSTRGSCSTD